VTTVLTIVRARDGDVDALSARLRALCADGRAPIDGSRVEVHLPGVLAPAGLGVGALTWECTSDAPEPDLLGHATVIKALQGAEVGACAHLVPLASGYVETAAPLIKRTLLLRVRTDASTAARERFEADLAAMPEHISTIRSWRLSRIAGTAHDLGGWTHAWEQEFASLEGLTGEYMTHPYHWTTVDAWFDAEVPDHIVEPALAHLFTARDVPWSRDELARSPTS
jgi:stress responsive alpha/beta barrel protein